MCPNMTMAPLNDTKEGGFYGMQKPKVVVVVVNKAPPQGFFGSFYAKANDFFTATSWMTSSTPPVKMTTTPLTTPTLTPQVARNEPAALTVVTDGSKILYNCTANVSELNFSPHKVYDL
jgi:hypothetical protein